MLSKRLRVLQKGAGLAVTSRGISAQFSRRQFHQTSRQQVIKQLLLADIGEGITECQLIQWFVQEGARVEQFDKLCEVQSDKASVEITSSYDGVVKKLHYNTDDMAITGKPLIDIDVLDDPDEVETESKPRPEPSKHLPTLATPAVRHLTKGLKIDIADVRGTGRDGRVLKEDVQRHIQQQNPQPAEPTTVSNRRADLTPIQQQMFKTMTRSLSIPHFLYTTPVDMSRVTELRRQMDSSDQKVTAFAIILKAVSLAFRKYEILNAALDPSDKPALIFNPEHNFGIAVDTPSGLVVPVLRNVQSMSIDNIAAAVARLSQRAREKQLTPDDFKDATFTISNIGSIGGGAVAPVISDPQVAILGIGRSRLVPAFNEQSELCKREELVMSWSADHRVVDGATCARCAEEVRRYLEAPETMLREMI